jgi:hypothetical protein
MSKEIQHELDEDQYRELKEIKDNQGRTWTGLLLAGARALEGTEFPDDRLDGLKHDWAEDQRVFPEPGNDRIGSFKAGWTKAEQGVELGSRALEGLSWHNLGWRLGMIFGETPTELEDEFTSFRSFH